MKSVHAFIMATLVAADLTFDELVELAELEAELEPELEALEELEGAGFTGRRVA